MRLLRTQTCFNVNSDNLLVIKTCYKFYDYVCSSVFLKQRYSEIYTERNFNISSKTLLQFVLIIECVLKTMELILWTYFYLCF